MKKKYIAAGLAAAVICTGVFAASQAGLITFGQALSSYEVNELVNQRVREAMEDTEERYKARQQEKDARIAELEEQVEKLAREQQAEKPGAPAPLPGIETPPIVNAAADEDKGIPEAPKQDSPVADSSNTVYVLPVSSEKDNTELSAAVNDAPSGVIAFEVEYAGSSSIFDAKSLPEDIESELTAMNSDYDYTLEEFAEEIFYWTNIIREEHGLPKFERDDLLDEMAQVRATEGERMTHTRPDGSTPDTIFAEYGSSLRCTGENIAGAGGDPKHTAYGFLKTSHRRCVLDPDAKYMGVGCRWTDTVVGDRIAVLQLFAK